MKSYLLLAAAALVASTATAQTPALVNMASKYNAKVATSAMLNSYTELSDVKSTPAVRRAQSTASNPTAFYKRPKGTLYLGWDNEGRSFSGTFAVYPPYAPIQFKNASTNPSATIWSINNTQLTSANAAEYLDASNNLNWPGFGVASINASGQLSYYGMPVLVNGVDSFTIAEGVTPFSGDAGFGYTVFPLDNGFYLGASGPTAFYGDRTLNGTARKEIAFYQPFDKPVGAFVLNGLSLFAWCNGANVVTASSGLKAYVYNVKTSADGTKEIGDSVLATLDFVADSVKLNEDWSSVGKSGSTAGLLTFYPLADDGLGGKMIQPVALHDEFAIAISGFSGKNIGFFFGEAPSNLIKQETQTSITYDESVAPNARFIALDTVSNQIYDYSYSANYYPVILLKGYQDYAGFYLSSKEDNGTVTRFTEFTAPTEGGVAVNDSSYAAQLYTALPWQDADGNNNYSLSVDYNGETPWLVGLTDNGDNTYSIDQVVSSNSVDQSKSFVNTASWAKYGQQVVGFVAEALPSGKNGRHANIRVNYNGAQTSEIIVRQGDDNTVAGIDKVAVDNNNGASRFDNRVYNLAGQQVNKAYKGIVISNGKKYIQK